MNVQLTYYQRIGAEKLQEMVSLFYDEIRKDEVLKPMYPGDMEAAERRLYLFLVQYLGGPATYSERRGHPRLRMRHQTFPINEDARDRWLKCMSTAMENITMDDESRKFLWAYFVNTANFLRNK